MVRILEENGDFTIAIRNENISDAEILKLFPNAEFGKVDGLEPIKPILLNRLTFMDLPQIKEMIKKTNDPVKRKLLYNKALQICQDKFSCVLGYEASYVEMISDKAINFYGKHMAFLFLNEIRGIKSAKEALLKILSLLAVAKPEVV